MIDFFVAHASAISFTIVVSGFLINLLLGIFVVHKKNKSKHLSLLCVLFFLASLTMLLESLSYVSAIMKLGILTMRILTVLVMWSTTMLGYTYYSYLLSYYEYKRNASFSKIYTSILFIYSLIFCEIYTVLSPTGLLFDVSSEGRYMVTSLSFVPFICLLPIMVCCLYTIHRGRHLTSKAITTCFFLGCLTLYIGGAIDSMSGISTNFLWRTLMNLILYYVIMQDQEHELEAAIKTEQVSRARSDFLTNMSHDIRTPMNAVLGFTELAKRDLENTELVKDHLDKISLSGEYLLSLINDVLDMSRIENGGLFLEESPMDISATIDEVETIVSGRIAQKEHHLKIEKTDLPVTGVIADKLRINQIFVNILGNAIKYTDPGGEISLSVSALDKKDDNTINYMFVVRDNGFGMDEDYLKHIFEPFSREHSSTVSKQQGTGLGMAITHSIIELMGGDISVESKVGLGSTFTVILPLKTCDISLVKQESDTEVKYDFTGKRVLLVEDNELNRMIATKLLEEKGIILEIAKDGKEALQTVENNNAGHFDAILMDIQMPIMNGYESTLAIRSLDYDKSKVPIIAMSANAFQEDIDEAFKSGMNGYVKKPIDLKELFSTLDKFI